MLYGIVKWKINKVKSNKKLKELIKINNGKLYFIYAEYNNYDFLEYFENNYKEVECIKINSQRAQNALIEYLIKSSSNKSYPRLAKIQDDNVISKEHYNSFKYYYKRNNNIKGFLSLLNQSINNLNRNDFYINEND